uniref:Apple domain-containing protein n=1 Tax=Panagrolaimus sp. ES5 TaxID=591445 RepID=A0AC34FWR4_9BILA
MLMQIRYLPQVLDCRQACAAEKTFNCTGFLWPADGGDCYLYDKMNLAIDIFRNNQNSYVMYVRVCDGATAPSVGFCEFVQNATNVTGVTSALSVTPGIAAESSCREFCIAKFQGPNCEAYVVSPNTKVLSQCVLYSQIPTGLTTGTSNFATCLQTATRTPLTGSAATCANTTSTNLSQVCTGGSCTSGGTGGTGGNNGGAPTSAPVPETGCRFYDIDPQSRPSTVGFKAVGAQAKTAATSLCGWQKVRGGISADGNNAKNWKSLGYAINSDHCG